MLSKLETLVKSKEFGIIKKLLRLILLTSIGFSFITSIIIVKIEFHLNRGGDYCNSLQKRLIYLEGEQCYVDLMHILVMFAGVLYVYFVLYFIFLFVISATGFMLYLVRDRRYLGGDKSVGGR